MAVFDPLDEIRKWKYEVKELRVILPNNKNIQIPTERLKEVTIEHNYEEFYFPLCKIKVILDSDTYYRILQNKSECEFYLRIDQFYVTENDGSESIRKRFLNGNFKLWMDENTEDMYRSLKEDEAKNDYEKTIKDKTYDLREVNNEITFYLFKPVIDKTKLTVNKLLHRSNVTDAFNYLMSVANITNLVMAQPNNTTIYYNLYLPPLQFLEEIEFIDTYYGIYRDGSIIYFDFDYTYVIPYNGICTAWEPGIVKITNLVVPKSTNVSHENFLGQLKKPTDPGKNYVVTDYKTIGIQNEAISYNYLKGNDVIVLDTYSGTTSRSSSKQLKNIHPTAKYSLNQTVNPFYASMYAAQTTGKNVVIRFHMENYDAKAFAPNREYNVIFEDLNYTKQYNGKYLIAGISHTLLSEGRTMYLDGTVVLRKID